MRTLVIIRAHAKEQRMVYQNLPWYIRSGCDLVGVDGNDAPLECWPETFKMCIAFGPENFVAIGKEASGPQLLVEMFDWFVNETDYDSCLATEADSMFVGAVPEVAPSGFGTFIAGYCPPQWNCGSGPFLHPPFWMRREVAVDFVKEGKQMVASGDIGNGSPDVFTGMVCRRAGILIEQQNVYSTNGLDMRCASKLSAAKLAYNTGCWHIHGVKRQDHIDYITGVTNEFPKDVINE